MKIIVTDGSPAAFFSAVFDAFRERDCVITSDPQVQLTIDSEIVRAEYDAVKCERVRRGIAGCDRLAEKDILLALRSNDTLKEQTALEYIRKLMETRAPIRKRLNLPEVIELNDIVHKVTREAERFRGFLRFMESREGAFYAPYTPDNDITDMIMPHFAERFKSQKFVIHDLNRKIAGMYDGRDWIMGYAGEAEIYLSEYERSFENLWKKYYNSVNIAERPHEKQMRGYMPARYWRFLPEKNGD